MAKKDKFPKQMYLYREPAVRGETSYLMVALTVEEAACQDGIMPVGVYRLEKLARIVNESTLRLGPCVARKKK